MCVGLLHQGGRVLFGFVFLGEEALRMLDGGYLTFHSVAVFNIALVIISQMFYPHDCNVLPGAVQDPGC